MVSEVEEGPLGDRDGFPKGAENGRSTKAGSSTIDGSVTSDEALRVDTTSDLLSRQISPPSNLTSPLLSPNYPSTTDDDEGLHMVGSRSIATALSKAHDPQALAELRQRLVNPAATQEIGQLGTYSDALASSTQSSFSVPMLSRLLSAPLTPTTTASSTLSSTIANTALSPGISAPSTSGNLTVPSPTSTTSTSAPSSTSALDPTTTQTTLSPSSTAPQPTPQDESDYAATARWGYTILVLTWIIFVVGMGSCFDIWTWAWDVGETPYAPPELEDDDSLPITGYYPAVLVLVGGVMSWVWVIVAWVGMKEFRHAKGVGGVGMEE